MVLLDCEVAWYGDPAFDLAFMLSHFFLKSLAHPTLHPMIESFWQGYQQERPAPELEARVTRLLPMLLLARVDGKSPVEYLTAAQQRFIRDFVQAVLPTEITSLTAIADSWFSHS
jgi:hypothetical protein